MACMMYVKFCILYSYTCTRLLPNGRPVAWGALFASAGEQISEQVAWTGTLLDSSSLSCKYDPNWN